MRVLRRLRVRRRGGCAPIHRGGMRYGLDLREVAGFQA